MRTIYTALCTYTLNTSKHLTSTHCTIVHYKVGCTLKFTVPNTVMRCTSSRLQPLVVTPWLSPGWSIVSRDQQSLTGGTEQCVKNTGRDIWGTCTIRVLYYTTIQHNSTAQLYCTTLLHSSCNTAVLFPGSRWPVTTPARDQSLGPCLAAIATGS